MSIRKWKPINCRSGDYKQTLGPKRPGNAGCSNHLKNNIMEYNENDVWIGGVLVTLEYDKDDCYYTDRDE